MESKCPLLSEKLILVTVVVPTYVFDLAELHIELFLHHLSHSPRFNSHACNLTYPVCSLLAAVKDLIVIVELFNNGDLSAGVVLLILMLN